MGLMNIYHNRKNLRRLKINEKGIQVQEAEGIARDPAANKVKIAVPKVGGMSATDFENSPVDLNEIGRAYYSDSYISRAVNKLSGLMFKSGWRFSSLNADALEYVEMRFRLMAEATELSTEELLREAGMNYVLYGNTPIIKTRGQENLDEVEAEGYYGGEPITGLFIGAPQNFLIQRDDDGNVTEYQMTTDQGSEVTFSPEDVLHMTYHKPSGRAFGVPYISTVIDDVLILRQVEENIARLIYRNIFPLQTYTVGLPEAGKSATDEEIEEVRAMIEDAPLDSIMVMPERHKIDTVSANSGALDAYNYLRYFRQRVFTGLGVSESTMGIGDSSNRSTSDNQSSDLLDLVKEFQHNFSSEFQKVVNEILFEGGYDPTINKEDRVEFQFTEIEQAAKIARENHNVQLFMQNAISFDELRELNGMEPTEDLSRFWFQLIQTTNSGGSVENADQPENQHGSQDAPPADSLKDSVQNKKTFKKINENSNSLLTKQIQMVNLGLDNVDIASVTENITRSWAQVKEVLAEGNTNIPHVLDVSFDRSLFASSQEKKAFTENLTKAIAWKQASGSDWSFFEHSVWALYTQSLHRKEARDE